jgi:hypothetical protein
MLKRPDVELRKTTVRTHQEMKGPRLVTHVLDVLALDIMSNRNNRLT